MTSLEDIRYFIVPELYEYLAGLEAKVDGDTPEPDPEPTPDPEPDPEPTPDPEEPGE